jgi:hypothetical protein
MGVAFRFGMLLRSVFHRQYPKKSHSLQPSGRANLLKNSFATLAQSADIRSMFCNNVMGWWHTSS